MILKLVQLPADRVRGIYTISGFPGRMPARSLFLHPDAAESFLSFSDEVVVSDLYRTAESSLAAVKAGRGAKPPGYSGHNYGLSEDIDLETTLKERGEKKPAFDAFMAEHGWYCHRRDHKLDFEAWHYNFLGAGTEISPKVRTTAGYIEARITALYGQDFNLDIRGAQAALTRLRLYHGEVDGLFGPLSRAALETFQRAWNLTVTVKLDAKTCRTLAFVAAEKQIAVT